MSLKTIKMYIHRHRGRGCEKLPALLPITIRLDLRLPSAVMLANVEASPALHPHLF